MGFIAGTGAQPSYVRSADLILEFFRDSGNAFEMAVDGSVTPVAFEWENEEPFKHAVISRLLVDILDAGPTTSKFGGIIGGLTNGMLMDCRDPADVIELDFLDGNPIKQNHEFGRFTGPDWVLTIGAGTDAVNIRWSLSKSGKELLLPPGFKLRVTVRDDLRALDSMSVALQGYRISRVIA